MGETRNPSERKRPLARPRRRWEDNIKMDFKQRVDWSHATQELLSDSNSQEGLGSSCCSYLVIKH
jgi:hypothetical protein